VHDLEVKINHARRFLEEGNKVKITCRFRGREITHPEAAEKQLMAVVERTRDLAVIELTPRMEGRNMTLVMAPGVKQSNAARPKPPAPRPSVQPAPDELS
jgi:translation initiation factor IF-3